MVSYAYINTHRIRQAATAAAAQAKNTIKYADRIDE